MRIKLQACFGNNAAWLCYNDLNGSTNDFRSSETSI
jgi:hypothetical protein